MTTNNLEFKVGDDVIHKNRFLTYGNIEIKTIDNNSCGAECGYLNMRGEHIEEWFKFSDLILVDRVSS